VDSDNIQSSTIQIYRAQGIWQDRNRLYKVLIDRQHVGSVAVDETAQFSVTPGTHTVQVKIEFGGSKEVPVVLKPGQFAALACRGGKGFPPFNAFFRRHSYLDVHPLTEEESEYLKSRDRFLN
jgi:hypothetical protein